PRLIIGSVPYAMHADNAASAQTAADGAQATADANTAGIAANATAIATNATAIADEAAARTAADAIHDADIVGNATALAALEARIAALESPPCVTRFCACSDGVTVEDTATGLLWERKTTTGDVHDVTNTYTWSSTGSAPDGTAYTVFLPGLNGASFAGHADWRLPFISELQSILVGLGVETVADADPPDPNSGLNETGQSTTCQVFPCIDYQFAALGGPTAASSYWSASNSATSPFFAWGAGFSDGFVGHFGLKEGDSFVRAVRAGSCSS
ncbi:MAG: DUF1566 domain-containing protein, partial [Myxococcota bacterium]|nr:DUF1566 domain-containing protein [Myxococcota bacterium]